MSWANCSRWQTGAASSNHPTTTTKQPASAGFSFLEPENGHDRTERHPAKAGRSLRGIQATNDELLKAKADGKGVEAFEAKLSKINEDLGKIADLKSAVQELEKKMNRPGAAGETDPLKAEHKQAFGRFLRKGIEDGLGELQAKAYNITTDGDGGYAVPEELDREHPEQACRRLPDPPRSQPCAPSPPANTRSWSTRAAPSAAGLMKTTPAPPPTAPANGTLTPFMGELYAYPQATQQMLDDVFFNAEVHRR
jgi:HK97 family phage major capsid protein